MTAATVFPAQHAHTLSLSQCAITSGLTLGLVFALCWAAAAAGYLPGAHMFISLFTAQPVDSTSALGVGLMFSLGSGLVIGAIWALVYNAFAFLQRP